MISSYVNVYDSTSQKNECVGHVAFAILCCSGKILGTLSKDLTYLSFKKYEKTEKNMGKLENTAYQFAFKFSFLMEGLSAKLKKKVFVNEYHFYTPAKQNKCFFSSPEHKVLSELL